MIAPQRGREGFILVAVLWLLGALATLALIYSAFISATATAVAGATDRVQTEAALRAAIEMTCFQRLNGGVQGTTNDRLDIRVGSVKISTSYRSEAARVDLNHASRELLSGLIASIGISPVLADAYASRIVGWRTRVSAGSIDDESENSLYRAAGLNYLPRHAPFPHVDELWLVHGIPKFVIARILPSVTIYNGRGSINVLEAAPQVIAALPKMTPERVQSILSARELNAADPSRVLTLAAAGGDTVAAEPSRAMRMTVQMTFDNGRQVKSEAVVFVRDDAGEACRVLNVRNDLDEEARVIAAAER
ncbi:general secretion pathway protein K [Rhodopseudomonas rhenobacensis]|uniref:General secretion pathway protein K n=1 Tax=Rhodopseudomonas rhenobacensis TaxID=87461 RepID=A0A7W7Z5T9_9BRAD|nr:type II secretion system protein GspK [Rhodopseudomonas rhenobacensis]MBB5048566.1 general secretion pathway protein K [Rhodopseudomonas rhenobacensis]